MQPGLLPPNGIWLGANFECPEVSDTCPSWADNNPIIHYEEIWGVEIDLYRVFKG